MYEPYIDPDLPLTWTFLTLFTVALKWGASRSDTMGPSPSIYFFQLLPLSKECLLQQTAAQRKGAALQAL